MASPSITSLPEKTINTYLSKWNASSLPIQYVITNDKFPVGATVTNYYTEVMVYVGGSLIGTIKQIPDSNNETKIDVRKYVQSTMLLNKGGTGQVDDNAWKEIYITGSENYVDSSGVTQSNAITGGGSGVIHYGVLSALQFGNANGGNMYDYVLDTNKLDLAKWMQVFERGKIVDYNNLTLSIIVDEDSEEFNLEVNQYDINDNLLDVSVITTNPEGGGVYRFSLDEQDINYDTFTTYITIQGVVNDTYGANLTELYYIDVDLGCSTAPGTPIELALSNITDSSIELNWVDKAYRETSYVVQRSLTGTGGWTKIATIPKNSQTYTDSGLTVSTTYYYRIKANQTDGISSGYSNIENAKTTPSFQIDTNWNDATANDGAYTLAVVSSSTSYNWYIDGVLRAQATKTLSVPADSGWLDGTTKTIKIVSDDFGSITGMIWNGKKLLNSLPSFQYFTSLSSLFLYDNSLSGTFPALIQSTLLTDIRIYDNSFSGTIPSLTGLTGLTLFRGYNNSFSGSIPDLATNQLGFGLDLNNNSITGWTVTSFNVQLDIIDVSANAIDVTSVNNALIALDALATSGGTIDISGGTNAAPTGAGATAKSNLQGRAWTVTTN